MEYHQFNNFFLEQRRIGIKKKANAPDFKSTMFATDQPSQRNSLSKLVDPVLSRYEVVCF
jgi:hypothetical protein